MTVRDITYTLWYIVNEFMALEIPIGEYKVTFMQMFIFFTLMYLLLKLLFGLGSTKGGDYD